MTIAQWGLAKYGALRTLISTIVQLKKTTAYKDRTHNATGEFTASAVSLDEVIEYHDYLGDHALARCERVLANAGFHCITRPLESEVGLLYAVSETANH